MYRVQLVLEKTIQSIDSLDEPLDIVRLLDEYSYQEYLTGKLDKMTGDFDQATINEIALWKINRYPHTSTDTENEVLTLLNRITGDSRKRDDLLTTEVMQLLLKCRGIRLPMASTILRFKNPYIYQIIDQRVFRFIYGESYKEPSKSDTQITCYLDYLQRLEEVCDKHGIPFHLADRVLYQADTQLNNRHPLRF